MYKRAASLAPGMVLGNILMLVLSLISSSVQAVLPVYADGKELPSLAPMLEQVTPAVVNIATEGKVQVRLNPLFQIHSFVAFLMSQINP